MKDHNEPLLQPHSSAANEGNADYNNLLKEEHSKLSLENEVLKKKLHNEEFYQNNLYKEWSELKASIIYKNQELEHLKSIGNPGFKIYRSAFYGLLLIATFLFAFNVYSFYNSEDKDSKTVITPLPETDNIAVSSNTQPTSVQLSIDSIINVPPKKNNSSSVQIKETQTDSTQLNKDMLLAKPDTTTTFKKNLSKYVVKVKSYFYNKPDSNEKRNTFVLPWNDDYGILTALADKNGFIYIVFTNHAGRTSKGWIRKTDLEPLQQ